MKSLRRIFAWVHALMAFFFGCAAVMLIFISVFTAWHAIAAAGMNPDVSHGIIEAVGLLAVAVVALQIAQTIVEEEVIRQAHVSAPTRVRRFLSRFLVVVIVALAIEGLVAAFKALHAEMSQLLYAAMLLFSVGVILAGWGLFIHFNRQAEELEPEAMEQAKSEDRKLEQE